MLSFSIQSFSSLALSSYNLKSSAPVNSLSCELRTSSNQWSASYLMLPHDTVHQLQDFFKFEFVCWRISYDLGLKCFPTSVKCGQTSLIDCIINCCYALSNFKLFPTYHNSQGLFAFQTIKDVTRNLISDNVVYLQILSVGQMVAGGIYYWVKENEIPHSAQFNSRNQDFQEYYQ